VALGIGGARSEDLSRGRAIYETRCVGCHGTSVHSREARKAKDFAGVRAAVQRFAGEAGGVWQTEEINDVAAYLNQLYYRYPCPPEWCKTAKQAAPPAVVPAVSPPRT
jgi:hypothetical protein